MDSTATLSWTGKLSQLKGMTSFIELEVRTSVLLVMVMIVMLATSTWEIETRSAGSGVPTSKVSSGKLSWY